MVSFKCIHFRLDSQTLFNHYRAIFIPSRYIISETVLFCFCLFLLSLVRPKERGGGWNCNDTVLVWRDERVSTYGLRSAAMGPGDRRNLLGRGRADVS